MTETKHPECVQFGQRLRILRKQKGYSQEGFALHADMHRTYLGGLERGERNPTLSILVRIAKALGVSTSKLLQGVGTSDDA